MAKFRLTEPHVHVLLSEINDPADLLVCDTPSVDRSMDRIHSLMDKQKKENTVNSTKRDFNILTHNFCSE
mgnify:CR=1 FL=1